MFTRSLQVMDGGGGPDVFTTPSDAAELMGSAPMAGTFGLFVVEEEKVDE